MRETYNPINRAAYNILRLNLPLSSYFLVAMQVRRKIKDLLLLFNILLV